jgi:chromosome segregation ATPase
MRVERAVASRARHCTPHTATGAVEMAEESSRTAAGGTDHAGVVQSMDERLETSRPLERDEVGGTRADVSMPEMPAEDPVKDLLTRKESELMALRSRRVSDLESRVERGATELAELRSRMHQLREDFQYNLNLLDERDQELERYDAQFARAATEAEDAARQVREARLAAQEAVSEARRWQQRASESEAHHARRVAEMRDAVERERFNRDESLLRQREEFDAHKRALMRQIAERDELLETAQSDARDAVAAEARRAREGVDVEKHDADAEASARKAEKEALERRVEEARRRAAAAEQEAEAARAAKA